MALCGFGAKCGTGWMGEWMGDTPQTVMTTRAPAVLTREQVGLDQLSTQLGDLYHPYWDLCFDHFNTQTTEKYSTVM